MGLFLMLLLRLWVSFACFVDGGVEESIKNLIFLQFNFCHIKLNVFFFDFLRNCPRYERGEIFRDLMLNAQLLPRLLFGRFGLINVRIVLL